MTDDCVSLPKPTDSRPHRQLLDKYLAGECTLPERVAMERWILAHPKWAAMMGDLIVDGSVGRERWAETADTTLMEDRVFSRIDTRTMTNPKVPAVIRSTEQSSLQSSPLTVRASEHASACRRWWHLSHFPPLTRYAIGAIASAIVCIGWYTASATHSERDAKKSTYVYATGHAERATITLPDGSRVVMNVASKIQIPTNFTTDRTVRLEGEALFSVNPSSEAPFIVVSGPSVTRVLGTTFLVRYYDTDTAATIAVREGKVAVQSNVLTAMEQISVNKAGVAVMEPVNLLRFSFESGVLQFRNTPLKEAIPDLNRWYNADIRLGDPSLADQKVVGGFRAGSLTDLAVMFEWTFNLRVVRDGQVLTLYPKH